MSENNLDRFARGDLSPLESRELARKALDDSELFEDLTSMAVARAGLQRRGRQIAIWPGIAILAAAAIVILAVALHTPRPQPRFIPPTAVAALEPIFLAGADSSPAQFRGADSDSRAPKAMGSIISIEDGVATIDLGTLDGLSKGGEVDVIRGGQVIGKLTVTTVFRDHTRIEPQGGLALRAHDQVRVSAEGQLRAVLDQIEASVARGDAGEARRIAAQASIGNFDAGLSSIEDLNSAAIIAELHGHKSKAIELYGRALQANPSNNDRHAIESNLARVKGVK